MKLSLAAWVTLACVLAGSGAARAQIESREGIALQNQILELRQQVEALRAQPPAATAGSSNLGGYQAPAQPATSGAAAGGIGAELVDRVQRLEDSVRELRGRIDDADNARQRQFETLDKKIDDLAFKIDNSAAAAPPHEPGAAPAGPAAAAPPAAAVPAPPAPRRTTELMLQEGNAALAKHDYTAAEASAREVLAAGKGPHLGDAQFLLAQSLAGRKDYSGAAVAYDDAYNRARAGAHAPDSLLGLATSLIALGEKKAACETLDKLRTEFPTLRADLVGPVAASRRNAACH
jgi:TolA-binding protein